MEYPRYFVPLPPKGRTDILYWKVLDNKQRNFIWYCKIDHKPHHSHYPFQYSWEKYVRDEYVREVRIEELALII